MSKHAKTPHSVIAAVRDDDGFRAVALHKRSDGLEIHWAKHMATSNGSWDRFAAECGLAGEARADRNSGIGQAAVAVGIDPAAVAFYRINAPHVGREETGAIVRMQAESLLPLPPSQIEVAWRTTPSNNGNADVTIAAARRDFLRRLADDTQAFQPQTIVPACEGVARTWHDLFSERERQALIISLDARNAQICVVVNGYVTNAAVLDVGLDDLAVIDDVTNPSAEATAVIERFVQDLRSVLDAFNWSETTSWPKLVLSDGSERFDRVVAALNAAGLDVRVSRPKPQALGMPVGLEADGLYEYRAPLGLALMVLDGPADTLDLFARMNQADREEKVRSAWYSTTLAAVAAAVMLVALIATWCISDVVSERRLRTLVEQPAFEQALDRQTLLKTVARHRPDLLDLLTEVNAGENNGIILDTLHFKKGQMVTLMGRADNMEQMWQFQENLLDRKDIKDVDITNNAQDAKSKKIKFTMVFQYRNFTKKEAVL